MERAVGTRVVRGPDWSKGDEDGGEGHVGTVKVVDHNQTVHVFWDKGQQGSYNIGHENKFELRVFDPASFGHKHTGKRCEGCQDTDCMGIIWSCQECPGIYLCNTCYCSDQHDIRHRFKRFDDPLLEGFAVAKRSLSFKVRSSGLFVGAKVKSCAAKGDEHSNIGTVVACIPYGEHEASHNAVQVSWSNNETSRCRPGIDVICIAEMPGLSYYRDHLPVLGKNTFDVAKTQSEHTVSQQTCVTESENTLAVDEGNELRCHPHAGANPDPDLKHVSPLRVGDRVRIIDNIAYMRSILKERWCDDMSTVICKVGIITHKYTDGSIEVNFGNKAWVFLPACLEASDEQNLARSITTSASQPKDTTIKTSHTHQSTSSSLLETAEDLNKLFEHFSTLFPSISDVPPTFLIDAVAANHCALVFVTAVRCPHLVNCIHQTFTALMLACQKGYKEAAQILLHAHADANIADENRTTALMLAIIEGHADIAILLIQQGADPNLKDKLGRNAMIIAAYKLETSVIKELIARNADPNAQDENGNTALHVSIIADNTTSILDLVQFKRVNVLIRNKDQQTPLLLAAIKNDVKTIEVILNRCPAHKYPVIANEALQAAMANNNTDVVRLLIQLDIDVNRADEKRNLPLHFACLLGHFEISKLLVQAGTCVNKQNENGVTPLHLCIAKSSPHFNMDETEEVRTLNSSLEKIRERTDLACYLVKHGADVLIRDANGSTPLTMFTEENMMVSIKRSARVHRTKGTEGINLYDGILSLMPIPCVKFMNSMSDVRLIPCGHIPVCRSCAINVQTCPRCKSTIEERRTFALKYQQYEEVKLQKLQQYCSFIIHTSVVLYLWQGTNCQNDD